MNIRRASFLLLTICLLSSLFTILTFKRLVTFSTLSAKHCNVYLNETLKQSLSAIAFPFGFLRLPDDVTLKIYHHGDEDVYISRSLDDLGSWEKHILFPLLTILQENPSLYFIDLGANVGVYSLAVASLERQVVAVEALEGNCQRLLASLLVNNLQKHVTIVQNALSDERKPVTFYVNKQNVGGSKVLREKKTKQMLANSVRVLSIWMNDLLEVSHFRRAILKMDIEGSEYYALQHAEGLFESIDIPIVLMEWMNIMHDWERSFIIKFFTQRKYTALSSLTADGEYLNVMESHQWPMDIVWMKTP